MDEVTPFARTVRFGTFEVDFRSGELRKSGRKLKLGGQSFQVLGILLERPGEVVTREELQRKLWPDTFVDVDHGLNTAMNRIREALSDSADNPRFIETLPKRGYRFIAPVLEPQPTPASEKDAGPGTTRRAQTRSWVLGGSIVFAVIVLFAAAFVFYRRPRNPVAVGTQVLTRLTFDEGLQLGATWSPDGRSLAYSSDRSGKFDIWVQQVHGGDPVRLTRGPGHNWQPDWSPNGKYIAYRCENGEEVFALFPRWAVVGWKERSRTTDFTRAGLPIVLRFCSKIV